MPDTQDFQLPIKDILHEVPLLFKGQAEHLLNAIQNADLNHDGKKDLAQAVKLFYKLQPLGEKINKSVDFEQLADWLTEQKFVTDKPLLKTAILEAAGAIEKA